MEAKHTPRSWAYDEDDARIYFADGDVEPTIAYIERQNASPEQAKADGYLIAAAPELLEALLRLHLILWNDGPLAEAYKDVGPLVEAVDRKRGRTGNGDADSFPIPLGPATGTQIVSLSNKSVPEPNS